MRKITCLRKNPPGKEVAGFWLNCPSSALNRPHNDSNVEPARYLSIIVPDRIGNLNEMFFGIERSHELCYCQLLRGDGPE